MIEDKLVYEETYNYFLGLEKHLIDVSAYQNDEKHYLDLKNYGFLKSVRLYLTSKEEVIFNDIIIKYLLYKKEDKL